MSAGLGAGQHGWLGFLDPVGMPVAPAVLTRLGLWPEPQGRADEAEVAAALMALTAGDAWPLFGGVLGWPAAQVAGAPGGPALPGELSVALRDGDTLLEPSWALLDPPRETGRGTSEAGGGGVAPGGEPRPDAPPPPAPPAVPLPASQGGSPQLLVRIEAPGTLLDRRGALGGWEATPQQRFERLLRETGVPAGVLVGARDPAREGAEPEPVLRLVTAPAGQASQHLAWPLAALATPGGRAMLGGLKLLLDAHALFTGARSHRLPTILAESRAAQAEVSTRLAGQVLASLHELMRGLDAADPALVRGIVAARPHHLYEGLLHVLLRLIFILYAEDRGLMPGSPDPSARALYESAYALSGLHARLLDDAAQHAELMDERRGAWGQLLALWGLVERGHPGFAQARGGTLFDRRAFPFLLGQAAAEAPERVLPVSDGCVLRVLDALLVLDGERVAYRALSVEQIGSVYETVMGFTAEAAGGPSLAIRAGKANRVPVWLDLAELARTPPAERARRIGEWSGRKQLPKAVTAGLRQAADVPALAAALGPVVDARACPRGEPVAAGTPILQPTDERRRTGSHYTPPSLTEPIVRHALEPAFARIGADATPADVLDLKVCDPAAGSGAFLVEACRQLGARLVEAWDRWPAQRPTIPADETDLLHAKRLVAQHCLHGVDRNPLALDLAKLSLWLETLASEHQFTFLDHVLRPGDSLVGLPNPKITAVSWGKTHAQHTIVESIVRDCLRAAITLERLMRAEAEVASYEVQQRRHREAVTNRERAHLIADGVLEAFFAGANAKAREAGLAEVQRLVLAPDRDSWPALAILRDRLRSSPIGITSFHWELEFPGTFDRPNPGFDAIVGNPPFAGKNTVASGHHTSYPDWLKTLHPGAHGNADLAAHFFRRAFALLRRGGAFGLIATNTIRQGDTRATGLERIIAGGGMITRAVTRHRWEGEAAVVVSQVFVAKDAAATGAVLDGRPVRRISAYLVEGDLDGSPEKLRANGGKSFQGSIVLGMGFTFDDVNAAAGRATPLLEMRRLLADNPNNASVIKPYLGGEEINNAPDHTIRRYIINFLDWPLSRTEEVGSWIQADDAQRKAALRRGYVGLDYAGPVAEDWPQLIALVRSLVKPDRDSDKRAAYRDRWWQYAEKRVDLYAATSSIEHVIAVNCGATPHLAFARIDADAVFANSLAVFTQATHAAFATLQSRVHEVWARTFASSMKDDLRYTPSDCFETFPLPSGYADAPALEAAGQAYHDHRAALMVTRNQGMTPTYNRFHKADDRTPDIAELRRLHGEMDAAVLRTYGWDDLAERAAPAFLSEEGEDDHQYRGRLHWPAPFRDELLARLLLLNAERARAERVS